MTKRTLRYWRATTLQAFLPAIVLVTTALPEGVWAQEPPAFSVGRLLLPWISFGARDSIVISPETRDTAFPGVSVFVARNFLPGVHRTVIRATLLRGPKGDVVTDRLANIWLMWRALDQRSWEGRGLSATVVRLATLCNLLPPNSQVVTSGADVIGQPLVWREGFAPDSLEAPSESGQGAVRQSVFWLFQPETLGFNMAVLRWEVVQTRNSLSAKIDTAATLKGRLP